MKLRIFVSFLLTVSMLAMASITSADGITKRVKFARGKHSTVISGGVIRGDRDTYIVGAKAGQMMTLKITALENNAAFQVMDSDGEYLQDAGEEDDATSWTGDLPWTGDYKIIVGGTRGNASYKLSITIK